MITGIIKKENKRRPLSWYKEKLQSCVERERLNHSYKRVLLLEMLYEMDAPVNAEQLYFTMSREGNVRISINTVYRIIKLLVTFDLVIRIEANGSPKYLLNPYDTCEISVFCPKSGRTVTIDAPSHWQLQLVQMLRKEGLDISGTLELKINCPCEKEK